MANDQLFGDNDPSWRVEELDDGEDRVREGVERGIYMSPHSDPDGDAVLADRDALLLRKWAAQTDRAEIEIIGDDDPKSVHLHHDEVFLRGLCVVGSMTLNVAAGVISAYIYDKFNGREDTGRVEVEIEYQDESGSGGKRFYYKGPADVFLDRFPPDETAEDAEVRWSDEAEDSD